ncbi:tetratricopeptide repeat protein [Streptomyces pactum]|uniref:tetratricopeptide repeat protein n=1 Tax=Streptomyces pactum TaxID=68249 RepID=UPI00370125CF
MTTVDTVVERAHALIDLKRYDEAAALLGQHLAGQPDHLRGWTALARCHFNARRYKEALDAADTALRLDPENRQALMLRGRSLRHVGGRFEEAEETLRALVRLSPDDWYGYTILADLLCRMRLVRHGQANGGRIDPAAVKDLLREPADIAGEAIRLAPEEVHAYEVAWMIADLAGERAVADTLDRSILRLAPDHPEALARQAKRAAQAPGVKPARAADLYAEALAAAPDDAGLRRDLDRATYRLLRGVRWLALICVAAAGVMLDLFAVEGEEQRELPVSLGQRLWALVPMAALWAFGAWRRYRRLRTGVRLNVWSLVRRGRWARVVLAQAAWAVLCALLISQVPWSEHTVPQVLFWAGIAPTLATVWFDRRKSG